MINYGRNIRVVFTDVLYGLTVDSYKSFSLKNEFSETIPATSLFLYDAKTLEVSFEDFNNFRGNVYIRYDGSGGLSGIDIPIDAFSLYPVFDNLRPYGDYEYFSAGPITASGNVDPVIYTNINTSETVYMSTGAITASGVVDIVTYINVNTQDINNSETVYLSVGTITAAGNSYLIGEIPV